MRFKEKSLFHQCGFTLLEITVSLGVFIVLFTLTLGVYSATIKAEQRSIQIARLQKEAQLMMEILAKQIRSSKVDYGYYAAFGISGIDDPGTGILALLDRADNPKVFRFNSLNNTLEVCIENCLSAAVFTEIPPHNVVIENLTFYITPPANPFIINERPEEFPKITLVMDLSNTIGATTENLVVQQTVPQRLAGP